LGNSQEVTAGAVSSGDSVEVRVQLYERNFPEEPDRQARATNANDVRTPSTRAAFAGVTGIAPSRRMIVTCMWGVSDPPRARRGAKKGAAKWGSLTPHGRSARLRQRRRLRHRRHRAPPVVVPRIRRLARTWTVRISAIGAMTLVPSSAMVSPSGERCSRVSVPTTCSPSKHPERATRDGVERPRRPRSWGLDLLTGFAESSRGRSLTWTERAL